MGTSCIFDVINELVDRNSCDHRGRTSNRCSRIQFLRFSRVVHSRRFACVIVGVSLFRFSVSISCHGGYRYQRVPLPSNIEKWKESLTDWHIKYGSISDIDADLHDGYIKKMCEAIEANAANNTNKSAQLYRANQATGFAALLLIVPAVLFVVQDRLAETVPHQIEIVDGKIQLACIIHEHFA